MPEQVGSLYARVGADASSFHRTMGGVSSSLRAGSQRFSVFGRAGSSAFALIAAGGAAIGVLKGAVSAAGDFESTVAVLGAQTHKTGKGLAKMSDYALKLGADVKLPGTSAQDAADAMLELAKGGLKANEVMKASKGVLIASAAGNMANADAANTVVGALGAFNLKAGESVRVANLLAGGANASTASMQDMAFSLQMGGAAANAAHVPIQQFVAMTAELANAGIKGSDAGTSLKSMFLALAPTTKKAKELVSDFGLSAYDAHHKMLPMPVIIGKYHKALAGMSDEQRTATLKTIFGTDAYRAANVIFGAGAPVLDKLTKEVSKEGQAAKLAAAKNSGMKGAIDGVKSSWNTFQIVLGTRVSPVVKIAGKRLANFLGDLTRLIKPTKELTTATDLLAKAYAPGNAMHAPTVATGGATAAYMARNFPKPEPPPGFAEGLQNAVKRAFAGIDWAGIGRQAALGFTAGLGAVAKYVPSIINQLLDAFESHRAQIADIGAQILVSIFLKLADPSFWAKHWELAVGVALAVGPMKFAKLGGKLVGFLLKPFEGIAGKLGALMGDAVLSAAAHSTGVLGRIGINIAGWVERGVPAAAKAAIWLGGKVITGIFSGLERFSFKIRFFMTTTLVAMVTDAATWVYDEAKKLGGNIVSGLLAGIKDLPGKLKGALVSAAKGAFDAAKGALQIGSPSRLAANELGLPIAQGIVVGFLAGIRDLPTTLTTSLTNALNAWKTAVDAKKSAMQTAFGRLGEDIGRAFDAGTTKGLAKIAAKFDRFRAGVTREGGALTPSEQALKDFEDSRDVAGRQQALSDAQTARANASTPEEALAAQRQVDDALYAIMIADLQRKAEAERTAADAETAKQTTRLDAQQAKAELNYQAQRDLQKRHLDAKLASLELELAKNPVAFAKHHANLMKYLRGVVGPDLKASGRNLGLAFAEGLAESVADVSKAARGLATELQKYLKLSSPAEKGPLSTLDSWWTAMPKTLLAGVDGREFSAITSGIAPPSLGAALAAQGGGYGPTVIHVGGIHVEGSVVTEGQLVEKVRDGLLVVARRNPNIFGGRA